VSGYERQPGHFCFLSKGALLITDLSSAGGWLTLTPSITFTSCPFSAAFLSYAAIRSREKFASGSHVFLELIKRYKIEILWNSHASLPNQTNSPELFLTWIKILTNDNTKQSFLLVSNLRGIIKPLHEKVWSSVDNPLLQNFLNNEESILRLPIFPFRFAI